VDNRPGALGNIAEVEKWGQVVAGDDISAEWPE
jgi:hypothetical protein